MTLQDNEISKCPSCGSETKKILEPLIENGEIVRDLPYPDQIRDRVLKQLEKLELEE